MYEAHTHLKVSALCLSTVGFWRWEFKSKLIQFLYDAYYKILLTLYVLIVCSQFIEIFVASKRGLMEVSFVIGVSLLYSLGLVKIWVLRSNNVKNLTRKIQVTEQNIVKSDDEDVKVIFWKCINHTKKLNISVVGIGWTCNIMFCLMPFLSDRANPLSSLYDVIDNNTIVYRPRPLPLPVWVPSDRYKYYKTTYTWHLVISLIVPTYLVSVDNFLYSLITFGGGQLRILQYNFSTITNGTDNIDIRHQIVAENIMKCIEYHKTIIRFVDELSNTMSTFLMLDFFACGMQIAMVGFQVAVGKLEFQMMTTVTYFVTTLFQLYFFYWYGNEIMIESVNVSNAIWESEWYNCNESIKRTLLIVMMRAQKALTLSIGPFYDVSTSTMMTVIRTGYSYAAVMRRLYSDKSF